MRFKVYGFDVWDLELRVWNLECPVLGLKLSQHRNRRASMANCNNGCGKKHAIGSRQGPMVRTLLDTPALAIGNSDVSQCRSFYCTQHTGKGMYANVHNKIPGCPLPVSLPFSICLSIGFSLPAYSNRNLNSGLQVRANWDGHAWEEGDRHKDEMS